MSVACVATLCVCVVTAAAYTILAEATAATSAELRGACMADMHNDSRVCEGFRFG